MSCEESAVFAEGDTYLEVVCDQPDHDGAYSLNALHHDPEYGDWDRATGLHDRSKHPGWQE